MNILDIRSNHHVQRVRYTARALVPSFSHAVGRMLRRGFRNRLAAASAAMALATSSLLVAQPVGATGPVNHTMVITYDTLSLTKMSDGCCYDYTLEVYGSLNAHTNATGYVTDNFPFKYRNFGTWGKDPCEVTWSAVVDETFGKCSKKIQVGTWAFSDLKYCRSQWNTSCYDYYDEYTETNQILLTVHAGELITFQMWMKDYDSASADDDVCTASKTIGPFTDAQLWAFRWDAPGSATIKMPWNGNGECSAHVSMYHGG